MKTPQEVGHQSQRDTEGDVFDRTVNSAIAVTQKTSPPMMWRLILILLFRA